MTVLMLILEPSVIVQKINTSVPVPHLSASSVKLASGCLRAWWFVYIIGLRQPEGYEHLYGKRLHGSLERYQLGQDPFPAGWDIGLAAHDAIWLKAQVGHAIAKGIVTSRKTQQIEVQMAALLGTGAHHLDERGLPRLADAKCLEDAAGERRPVAPTHYHPDERVAGIMAGLLLPQGWGDLGYMTGFMDVIDTSLPVPKVSDHKTTKHRGYAKTAKSLAKDLQMLIYAAIALCLRPDALAVDLQHNVFIKCGRDAADPNEETVYAVNCRVTLEEVVAHWQEIIDQAKKIAQVRKEFPADLELWDQVPGAVNPLARRNLFGADACGKEPEACRAYRGCAFKDACFKRASVLAVVAKVKNAKPPAPPKVGSGQPSVKKVVDSSIKDTGSGPRTPFKGRQPVNNNPGAKMPFVAKKTLAPSRPKTHEWVFVKNPDVAGIAHHAFITNALLPNDEFMVILDHTDRSAGIPSVIDLTQAEMQGRTVCTTLALADLHQTLPAGYEVRPFSESIGAPAEPSTEVIINNPTPEPTQVMQQPTPEADAALSAATNAATHPAAQEVKRRPGRPASKPATQTTVTTTTVAQAATETSPPVFSEQSAADPTRPLAVFSVEERNAFAEEVADRAVEKLKAWVLTQLTK